MLFEELEQIISFSSVIRIVIQLQGILCYHVSVCEKIELNRTWKFVVKYSNTTPQEIIYSRSILETRKCTYLPAVLVDCVENGIPDCL
ncbi:hypothetical protein D917_05317 [Trichinella nativa]|uniref:Uncharacterized protein n=1 Tax=Trichinella nativa TaxID=6335 RepID=A0A1Y3F1G0_9BILA|nr:hypothetical protein D917_05317 [Trichinella nativa]